MVDQTRLPRGEVTEYVRDQADLQGVSERTIWRRLKSMAADNNTDLFNNQPECRYCTEPLPEAATVRRRYCDDTCRQYARRRRLARAGYPQTARP